MYKLCKMMAYNPHLSCHSERCALVLRHSHKVRALVVSLAPRPAPIDSAGASRSLTEVGTHAAGCPPFPRLPALVPWSGVIGLGARSVGRLRGCRIAAQSATSQGRQHEPMQYYKRRRAELRILRPNDERGASGRLRALRTPGALAL